MTGQGGVVIPLYPHGPALYAYILVPFPICDRVMHGRWLKVG